MSIVIVAPNKPVRPLKDALHAIDVDKFNAGLPKIANEQRVLFAVLLATIPIYFGIISQYAGYIFYPKPGGSYLAWTKPFWRMCSFAASSLQDCCNKRVLF